MGLSKVGTGEVLETCKKFRGAGCGCGCVGVGGVLPCRMTTSCSTADLLRTKSTVSEVKMLYSLFTDSTWGESNPQEDTEFSVLQSFHKRQAS